MFTKQVIAYFRVDDRSAAKSTSSAHNHPRGLAGEERAHGECGQHRPTGWGTKTERKGQRQETGQTSPFPVPSDHKVNCSGLPHPPGHGGLNDLNLEAKSTFLSHVVFVRYFITGTKKVTNALWKGHMTTDSPAQVHSDAHKKLKAAPGP